MIEHEQASWKISPIQATQTWPSPCSMEIRMKSCIEVVSQMQLTDMMKLSVGSDGRCLASSKLNEANERTLESLFSIHIFTCDISAFCKEGDMEIAILKVGTFELVSQLPAVSGGNAPYYISLICPNLFRAS